MSRGYLIDTNVLLWSWHEPHRLPRRLYELLQEDDKLFFVSLISIWEIHIKVSIGKLVTVENVGESVRRMGYATVPLLETHINAVLDLPLHHRDPYDRLLIAQAKIENLTVMATDGHFRSYDIPLA